MKYFSALTDVENEVIRLSEMRNLLAVITNGLDGSSKEEIVSTLHYIEGSIRDISENLSIKFQNLFDNIVSGEDDGDE